MIAAPNIAKDLARFVFWYPCRWLILILPLPVVCWCGKLMGFADYVLSGKSRNKRMIDNISRSLSCSKDEARDIVLKNLQNHLQNNLELIKYPQFTVDTINKYASFSSLNHLETALGNQHGAILLTAHFGAKQFLQVALGIKGYKINQLNFHMGATELTRGQRMAQNHRKKIEAEIPATFIPAKGFLRKTIECLKHNEALIIAGDGIGLRRHMDKSYMPYPFLGETMLFPASAVSLAKRTGAPIIPVFVVRSGASHKICFEPPIFFDKKQENDSLTTYINALELYIKQFPDHWEFWEEFDRDNLLPTNKLE